jgi:hypothetical protein
MSRDWDAFQQASTTAQFTQSLPSALAKANQLHIQSSTSQLRRRQLELQPSQQHPIDNGYIAGIFGELSLLINKPSPF